ncbi:unnamed protein product, partial [Brassica rapa subsp. trilocularis]
LKRASFTSSLFIISSFQIHIYHPPPLSVHLKEGISREAERRGCPSLSSPTTNSTRYLPYFFLQRTLLFLLYPLQGKETLQILLRNFGGFFFKETWETLGCNEFAL